MRRPLVSSSRRSRNAAATSSIPSVAARHAANSMASGMPSRCRQIAAIIGKLSACDEKSAPSSLALATKRAGALWLKIWSASTVGTSSGATRYACSPPIRKTSRLVAQAYERFGQRRCRVDDVFTVVKNQQKLLFGDGPCDGFGRYNVSSKSEPKSPGHRGRHEIGVGQPR